MARPPMNPLPYYMAIDITDITQTKVLHVVRLPCVATISPGNHLTSLPLTSV